MYFSIKLSIHGKLQHLFQMVLETSCSPDFKQQFLGKREAYLHVFMAPISIKCITDGKFLVHLPFFLSSSAMQQRGQWNIQHQECGTAKPVHQVIYGKTTILSKVVNTVNIALEEEALFSVERRSP